MSDDTVQRLKRALWRDDLLLPFLEEVLPKLKGEALLRAAEVLHDGVSDGMGAPFSRTANVLVVAGETLSAYVYFPVNEGGRTDFLCWSLAVSGKFDHVRFRLTDRVSGIVLVDDGTPLSAFAPRGRLLHRFRPAGVADLRFENRGATPAEFSVMFEGFLRDRGTPRQNLLLEEMPSGINCDVCDEPLTVIDAITSLGLPHPCDPPWTLETIRDQAEGTPTYCTADLMMLGDALEGNDL